MISVEMKFMWVTVGQTLPCRWVMGSKEFTFGGLSGRQPPSIILGECCFCPVTLQKMLQPITLTLASLHVGLPVF